jgi:hypothetical protein
MPGLTHPPSFDTRAFVAAKQIIHADWSVYIWQNQWNWRFDATIMNIKRLCLRMQGYMSTILWHYFMVVTSWWRDTKKWRPIFSGNTLSVQSTAIFEDLRLHRRMEMIHVGLYIKKVPCVHCKLVCSIAWKEWKACWPGSAGPSLHDVLFCLCQIIQINRMKLRYMIK